MHSQCLQDCALMYGVMANTGQEPGQAPPAVMIPGSGSCGGSSEGGDKPLAGKTAGVCTKVCAFPCCPTSLPLIALADCPAGWTV